MDKLTPEILSGLLHSYEASTQGTWHKGTTTHHTICDGKKTYYYRLPEGD